MAPPRAAPSDSARNASTIARTAPSEISWVARRTRTTVGIVYVTPGRPSVSRRSVASTVPPSSDRLSPAAGAAPRLSPASSRVPPSSVAMSPRRIVWPATVASGCTVIRPPAAAATVAVTSTRTRLLDDRIRRPEHLVGRLDRLRGHLVGALSGDERHEFLDHADVRVLEEALEERAAILLPRRAELRRTGGVGLLEQVLPERPEARGIGEARGLDLPDLCRGRLPRGDRAHRTVLADRDVGRAVGNRDRGLERHAVAVHEPLLRVHLERARAREPARAVGERHLEEPDALDRHVEGILRLVVVALHVETLHGGRSCAEADLDPRRRLRAVGARRAGRAERLVEEILEVGAALLEPRRVHVRQVVGDHVDVQLLRLHAGRRGVERADHLYPPDVGDGVVGDLVEPPRRLHVRFEATRHVDELDHAGDRIDVRTLDRLRM